MDFFLTKQLKTFLFGILNSCDSMTMMFEGLRALDENLNNLVREKPRQKAPSLIGCSIATKSSLMMCTILFSFS